MPYYYSSKKNTISLFLKFDYYFLSVQYTLNINNNFFELWVIIVSQQQFLISDKQLISFSTEPSFIMWNVIIWRRLIPFNYQEFLRYDLEWVLNTKLMAK